MRTAHIVTTEHEVGDRVLALCGKEHKVKVLWEDIPNEAPICRDCTNLAVVALDEADELILLARRWLRRLTFSLTPLSDALNPDDLTLDLISDAAHEYNVRRDREQREKADRKKAKVTCTCEWRDMGTRIEDPNCPIHGGTEVNEDLPPVAPDPEPRIETTDD